MITTSAYGADIDPFACVDIKAGEVATVSGCVSQDPREITLNERLREADKFEAELKEAPARQGRSFFWGMVTGAGFVLVTALAVGQTR